MLDQIATEVMSNIDNIQGSYVSSVGREDLGKLVLSKAKYVFEVPETPEYAPGVLMKGGGSDQDHILEEHLGGCAGYVNSRDVDDPALLTQGLTQLIDDYEPPTDDDAQEVLEMLVGLLATSKSNVKHVEPISAPVLAKYPVGDTSAGAVNLRPTRGPSTGTKRQFVTASAVAAASSTQLLNYVMFPKPEVIKVGKKVRQIVVEPLPIYQKFWHFFGHVVKQHSYVADGFVNGLSKVRGDFQQIYWCMYYDECVFQPELTHQEFFSTLSLSEDDKQAWEATVNRNSCYAAILQLLCDVVTEDSDHLAQVFAHYAAPVIKTLGHKCFMVPFKVPSGSFLTLHFNNARHKSGVLRVASVLRQHGMAWSSEGCDCKYCALGFKGTVSERDLSRIVGGAIQGDDRIRLSFEPKHDTDRFVAGFVDAALGSKTIVSSGGEFLRTKVRYCPDTDNLFISRDSDRIYAKLRHGDASRRGPENLLSAVASALMEAGDNPACNNKLRNLFRDIPYADTDLEDESYYRGMVHGDVPRPMGLGEVLARQNDMSASACLAWAKWKTMME